MNELTKLIKDDMRPALGVTEPGAIAFAVATAAKYVAGEIEKVKVALNSGMYKNAFTCGIPNSSRYGNLYAAALGAVAAKAELGLESLADITPEDDEKAAAMVEAGKVEAWLDHVGSQITIDATVETTEDSCTVHIRDSHTHIVSIEKNGDIIYKEENAQETSGEAESAEENVPVIHRYTLEQILDYVKNASEEEIGFIRDAFAMNLELLEEGLASERAVIAAGLLEENSGERISKDMKKTARQQALEDMRADETTNVEFLYYSKEAILKDGEKIINIANKEGLTAHANSVKVRLK